MEAIQTFLAKSNLFSFLNQCICMRIHELPIVMAMQIYLHLFVNSVDVLERKF